MQIARNFFAHAALGLGERKGQGGQQLFVQATGAQWQGGGVALFALSDLARFVTGQLLPVNGGFVFN